ncbi:hypothetical protein ABEV54_08815, partial [Peribacillus psychrosaccharolyticus]|uniref:hypothetical protein n=1 Tax=Peribacillus psychrosaccharolyticus TaxID=1407 RepID=UPI002E213F18|nr:hypothetical protein [Peribacillus psychrosaccharolyticus]
LIWILVLHSNENTCYPRADLGGDQFKSGELRRKLFPNPFEQEESKIIKVNTSNPESRYNVLIRDLVALISRENSMKCV